MTQIWVFLNPFPFCCIPSDVIYEWSIRSIHKLHQTSSGQRQVTLWLYVCNGSEMSADFESDLFALHVLSFINGGILSDY